MTTAVIDIDVTDDSLVEATETVTVTLGNVTGDANITRDNQNDTASLNITDNDIAAVTVEDVTAVEGVGLLFTVTLDNAVQGGTKVTVTLTDETAKGGASPLVTPEDYNNVVTQLTFAGTAGETQQFTVVTLNDAVVEGTETFLSEPDRATIRW